MLAAERTPFVGRSRERATLSHALEGTFSGRGAVVLIGGEPGVGKTRLSEELVLEAGTRAWTTVGRCAEEGGAPLAPWVEALEAIVAAVPAPVLRAALRDDQGELGRLLPELLRLFPDLPAPTEVPADTGRRMLFQAVSRFLVRLAKSTPLMLVLEDVHWADESSLSLLERIGDEAAASPILLVATYRDVDPSPPPALVATLERLVRGRRTELLVLRRFDRDGVAALVAGMTGTEPPGAAVELVHGETEGNTFFVEEVVRHLVARGDVVAPDGSWRSDLEIGELEVPESVRLVVGRRFADLSEGSRSILSAAAVVGREFRVPLVAAAGGVEPAEVLEALDEAERAALVNASAGSGAYRFTHELTRQTILVATTASRRRALHERVAAAIEEEQHDDLGRHAGALVHHLLESGATERLTTYAELAGDTAFEAAAHEDAIRFYEIALEHLAPDDAPARARLLARSGTARRGTGEREAGLANWRSAIEIYAELDAAEELGRVCADAAQQLSWAWAGEWHEALEMAQRGLLALGERSGSDRGRLLSVAGTIMAGAGDFDQAEEMIEEAMQIARYERDERVLGVALQARCVLCWSFGRWAESVEVGRRAAEAFRRTGLVWDLAQVLGFVFVALILLDRRDEARAVAEEGEPLAARLGHPSELNFVRRHLIDAFTQSGDLAELRRAAEEDHAALPARGGPLRGAGSQALLGMTALYEGNADEAIALGWRGIEAELPGAFGGVPWSVALLATAYAGRVEEARALFAEAESLMPVAGHPTTYRSWMMAGSAVEGLAVIGDQQRAAALHEPLLQLSDDGVVDMPWSFTSLPRALGIAAGAAGRWEEAERHLDDAARFADTRGNLPERAQVALWRGWLFLRRRHPGDHGQAKALLKEAIRGFAVVGMPLHQARARELLEMPTPGESIPAPEKSAAVFQQEGDYWTLAYDGAVARVRDAKGLHDIARLLASPGREFHVADLIAPRDPSPARAAVGEADLHLEASTGPVIDEEARKAYRGRLAELQEDLDEADALGDAERSARAKQEMDFLAGELAAAYGLGGRPRKAGDPSERARKAVTERIRRSVANIERQLPVLGRHLRNAIRTGSFCSYQPDRPVGWSL